MEFLAAEKLPYLVSGERSVLDEQVLYVSELQKLSSPIPERFCILAQLMEKTHKAAAEENNQANTLEAFVTRHDATQRKLTERFEKVKKRHQALTKLMTESAEIAR